MPAGATGDGGFRLVPELMSVVGCSGEEFASILKALGFRKERRPLAPTDKAQAQAPEAEAEAETPAIDEIWRPGKRRARGQDKGAGPKPRRAERAKASKRARPKPEPARAGSEPKTLEHSPFAALAELRGRLSARPPEGS